MRGREAGGDGLFICIPLEKRIPADHPSRAIKALTDAARVSLSPRFDALPARTGRASIAPALLPRATLPRAFFSIRSERQVAERIDHDLPFGWLVRLSLEAAAWHATAFTHNRDRLLEVEVARGLPTRVAHAGCCRRCCRWSA